MKIENIDLAQELFKQFRELQRNNERLHDHCNISVQINGTCFEISKNIYNMIRKALIEEIRVKREDLRKQIENL